MYNIGQKVRVQVNPTTPSSYGRVVGHGFREIAFKGTIEPTYLIELDTEFQFWSENKNYFISTLVCDTDVVKAI